MTLKENFKITARGFSYLFRLEKTYTVMMIISTALKSLMPYIPIFMSARIIDGLIEGRSIHYLTLDVILTVGLTFALGLAQSLTGRIKDYHLQMLYRNEAAAFADKTMEMDYIRVESVDTNLLRERIKIESQTGYNLFYLYSSIEDAVANTVQIISSSAMSAALLMAEGVAWAGKILLVLMLALVAAINYYTIVQSQKIEHRLFGDCVQLNSIGNYLFEHFEDYRSGMEIRLYKMEELVSAQVRKYKQDTNQLLYTARRQILKYTLLNEFLIHALKLAVYGTVIGAAMTGGVSVGAIAKYVSCMILLLKGIQGWVQSAQTLIENNQYLQRYFSFLDIPSQMHRGKLPVEKRAFCADGDNEYEIEFCNVSFRYPGMEQYALKDVSLKFRVGEKMAVVGQNGSGKTTFIKLLCRLYDPTEGTILMNGIDIRKYKYEEYLSLFSVVFQDFKLFAFSLGQNVGGRVHYDKEKAKQCLERAGFTERLKEMAEGMDTRLYKDFDPDGVEISGGEAQKIALARALYKEAPFIVLDEPTAALDPVAEYEVYSRFYDIVGNRTAIFISHRLSSCRFCNDIAVFHEGCLIQRGSHRSLLKDTGGKYAQLWEAQAQYYETN